MATYELLPYGIITIIEPTSNYPLVKRVGLGHRYTALNIAKQENLLPNKLVAWDSSDRNILGILQILKLDPDFLKIFKNGSEIHSFGQLDILNLIPATLLEIEKLGFRPTPF